MNVKEPLKAKGLQHIGMAIVNFIKQNKTQSVPDMHKEKFIRCFNVMTKAYSNYCDSVEDRREHLNDLTRFDCYKRLRQAVIEFIEDLPQNRLDLLIEKLSSEGLVSDRDNPMIKRYKLFVDSRKLNNDKTFLTKCEAAILILDLGMIHLSEDLLSAF